MCGNNHECRPFMWKHLYCLQFGEVPFSYTSNVIFFNKRRTILLSGVTVLAVLRSLLSPSSADPIAAKMSTVYFLFSGTTKASRATRVVKRYNKFLKTARKCWRAGRVGLNHSVAVK